MPAIDANSNNITNNRASRRVSFAPEIVDSREEPERIVDDQRDSMLSTLTSVSVNPNDGTGLRFKINFQENRLRFDQTFPEKLAMRVSESEFEIVLEQIHREFIEPLDKSQKAVRKWSVIVGATAPIVVGFILSPVLARRVSRHQKALKRFWIALRTHLKTINRETFYARGIEWRIERDIEKITERDSYNKMYCFRMEIVFRKPVTTRSGDRDPASRSIVYSTATTRSTSTINRASLTPSTPNSTRLSNMRLTDPDLFALMATAPGADEYDLISDDNTEGYDEGYGVESFINGTITEEDEDEDEGVSVSVPASPLFVHDRSSIDTTDDMDDIDIDSLFIKVDEPSEVTRARVSSTFEPPSPTPEASVYTAPEALSAKEKKLTFADLSRVSNNEEKKDYLGSSESVPVVVAGLTASTAAASLETTPVSQVSQSQVSSGDDPVSPAEPAVPVITTSLSPASANRASREEAFAQRQRKKFSRLPTLATQLYDIPESPILGADEDPVGDALTYMKDDGDDLIEEMLGVSMMPRPKADVDESFVRIAPEMRHSEDFGSIPVAAYPRADAFSSLYETDDVTPLDPTDSETEYTEVDGEVEYVRRKKWRVAPENAEKLSRVQTMSESIHPSSRRSSYLPLTKTTSVPKSFNFKSQE